MNASDLQQSAQYSVEMEQSVLGALMLDNDAIDRIGDQCVLCLGGIIAAHHEVRHLVAPCRCEAR